MSINDGGPAFPLVIEEEGTLTQVHHGMTLRDWFAGQALGALITNVGPHYHDTQEEVDQCRFELAQCAYGFADAMLEARKKASGEQSQPGGR